MEQWQQELMQCVRTVEQLERYLPLANREAIKLALKQMRLSITPHTLRLINFTNPNDPILLMTIPQDAELRITPEELVDPIGDEAKSPIPFLTHRYPDRVLVYASFSCSAYCRFCFRRFKTGRATPGPGESDIDRICEYLKQHPEVEEVILTGGDPLTLTDRQLERFLKEFRRIPTIQRIRIHTRVPVNLPSRITPALLALFRCYMDETHPLFVVTHFNHPQELARENIQALARLVDMGIVVRNQSVLLRGVNDSAATLRALFTQLTNCRVVPYYLHQLDLARGTSHFRVPIEEGMRLLHQLQGSVTGIALPKYMLDIPGGKGKVPLQHRYVSKEEKHAYSVETYQGEIVRYSEEGDSLCTTSLTQ